jgi:hypothetical protein
MRGANGINEAKRASFEGVDARPTGRASRAPSPPRSGLAGTFAAVENDIFRCISVVGVATVSLSMQLSQLGMDRHTTDNGNNLPARGASA